MGVVCLFILRGMFFAFLYGAIGGLSGSFFAQGDPATVARCLYFSFTTLTVGYGDLTAASNLGHTLSAAEALLPDLPRHGRVGRRREPPPPPQRAVTR